MMAGLPPNNQGPPGPPNPPPPQPTSFTALLPIRLFTDPARHSGRRGLQSLSRTGNPLERILTQVSMQQNNWEAFPQAIDREEYEMMNLCLIYGMDINQKFDCRLDEIGFSLGSCHNTALGQVLKWHRRKDCKPEAYFKMLKWLLERGADPNQRSCCYLHHNRHHFVRIDREYPDLCLPCTPVEQVLIMLQREEPQSLETHGMLGDILKLLIVYGARVPVHFGVNKLQNRVSKDRKYLEELENCHLPNNNNDCHCSEFGRHVRGVQIDFMGYNCSTIYTLLHEYVSHEVLELAMDRMEAQGTLLDANEPDWGSTHGVHYILLSDMSDGGIGVSRTTQLEKAYNTLRKARLLLERLFEPYQAYNLLSNEFREYIENMVGLGQPRWMEEKFGIRLDPMELTTVRDMEFRYVCSNHIKLADELVAMRIIDLNLFCRPNSPYVDQSLAVRAFRNTLMARLSNIPRVTMGVDRDI